MKEKLIDGFRDLEKMKVGGFSVADVLENPNNFLDNPEVIIAISDVIKTMSSYLREHQKRLDGKILEYMKNNNATKLEYISHSGEKKVASLRNGTYKCTKKIDEIERIVKKHNFDLSQFGDFEFKLLNWKEAKEKAKLGGNIQAVVNELFEQGEPSIKVEFKAR